jgi:hypothetical protein
MLKMDVFGRHTVDNALANSSWSTMFRAALFLSQIAEIHVEHAI